MGLSVPRGGPATEVDGEPHRSLRSLEKMSFAFREKTLSLLAGGPPVRPADAGRRLPAAAPAQGSLPERPLRFFSTTALPGRAGTRAMREPGCDRPGGRPPRGLPLSFRRRLRKTRADQRLVRLSTNVTRDLRGNDATDGVRGPHRLLGDLRDRREPGRGSASKVYRIGRISSAPRWPMSGMVSLPSEAAVYLGGTRIRTEKLSPGQFELKNISSLGGRSDVTVVIRATRSGGSRGSVTRSTSAETLLEKGSHEYSHNVGFLRRKFGEESDRYGPIAFSAFHNYG